MRSASPALHRCDEAFVVDAEGVVAAVVVPDPDRAEGVGVASDRADDVVAVEVGGVVEGARRGFAAFEPERRGSGRRPRRSGPGAAGRGRRRRSRPSRCRRSRSGAGRCRSGGRRSGSLPASRSFPSRLRRGRASSRGRRRRGRRRPAPLPRASPGLEDRLVFDEGSVEPPRPCRKTSSGARPRPGAAADDHVDPRSLPTAWLSIVRWTTSAPCSSAGAKTVAASAR